MKSGKKKSVKLHSVFKRPFNRVHNISPNLLNNRNPITKNQELDNVDQL